MSVEQLAILRCLEIISKELQNEKTGRSATKLQRLFGFERDTFFAAVQYGHDNKYILWRDGNWFTHLKSYSIPEIAYYPAIIGAVKRLWVSEGFSESQFELENTSKADSKISGPWTRPDITLISSKRFAWTIGQEFDVVTFEVKRPDSCNVLAVFEALAHTRVATKAYIVFPLSEDDWVASDQAQSSRVRDECVRHGIGLIFVPEVASGSSAIHAIRAVRKEIDHERCSRFLDAVLTSSAKVRIAEWK